MTVSAHERQARAALCFLTEPGDAVLGGLLRLCEPAEIVAAIAAADALRQALPAAAGVIPGLDRAVGRWRLRLGQVPPAARLAGWECAGYRLVCPGDPEWPTQLDDLGDARPVMLWLRGTADLRFGCLRSVAIVGARAATTYGTHVAADIAATLAELDWTVISGGAFGIDASAHRGALAVGGTTIAVLAGGLGVGYPKGHHELFGAIGERGLLVSECPPDQAPTRPGFLVRNRLIAALSRGTVVVEAAVRSGALSTARHANSINRLVMAVPGPVTSEQSAGCHQLIRDSGAVLVTSAREVAELVGPVGGALGARASVAAAAAAGTSGTSGGEDAGDGHPAASDAAASDAAASGPDSGDLRTAMVAGLAGLACGAEPVIAADELDPVTASVLQATPSRTGRGPAAIATIARVDLDTALRCLGLLAAAGHVERCPSGWRARRARRGAGSTLNS